MTQTEPSRGAASPYAGGQPVLRDGALLLRPLRDDDTPALWAAGQAEDIGRYTSIECPFTMEAAGRLIAAAAVDWWAGRAARFAIIADEGEPGEIFAGTASLLHIDAAGGAAEVGYWLGPAARGRGLARRAVALLSAWALGPLGLARLHLMVDLDNAPSHAVALAAGYRRAGEVYWRHPTDRAKDGPCLVYVLGD